MRSYFKVIVGLALVAMALMSEVKPIQADEANVTVYEQVVESIPIASTSVRITRAPQIAVRYRETGQIRSQAVMVRAIAPIMLTKHHRTVQRSNGRRYYERSNGKVAGGCGCGAPGCTCAPS